MGETITAFIYALYAFRCMSAAHTVTHVGLLVTKQWAADRSHLSDMMEAPQTWP